VSSKKRAPERASPRKRFRIEKLEERIAPKKGGTNHCSGSGGSGSGGTGSAY
jgi:hypothetical protein